MVELSESSSGYPNYMLMNSKKNDGGNSSATNTLEKYNAYTNYLMSKYEGFDPSRVVLFIVTNFFEEGYMKEKIEKLNSKRLQYLYCVYEHDEDLDCGRFTKRLLINQAMLIWKSLNHINIILIWFKVKNWKGKTDTTNISDMYIYKCMLKYQRRYYEKMFDDNVLCDSGLLFYSEKKIHCKSSWKDFRKVETNCSDWVEE